MLNTDTRWFTNEPEQTLIDRLSIKLKKDVQFFDVLVGYFRVTGFYNIFQSLEDVEKFRILVGLGVDRNTVEFINQSNEKTEIMDLSIDGQKNILKQTLDKEFANSEDSKDVEDGVKTFIEWLKCGKLEMRMYNKRPCHAKVYIMRKDPAKDMETFGSVITGSSNFSASGFEHNIEFNVELKDYPDVKFALDKFEEMWEDGIPVSDDFINEIYTRTWIRDNITPYEIYLKTLYEFFKEKLDSGTDPDITRWLPTGYMKLQYQIDAVLQAKKTLEAYNGVFIADVVGLGKTYICAMLAKALGSTGKKLIICPPTLKDYWEEVLLEFGVAAKVESLGKLDSLVEKMENKNIEYDFIFIDEAHRFRNQNTHGFELLHQICKDKKVILISATPMNNYTNDIEGLLYLFQPKHNSTIMPNHPDLEKYFSNLRGKLNRFEKGTPAYMIQLTKNAEMIRDDILRNVMIRRTRSEISEFYAEDLKRQNLVFPKAGSPIRIVYEFDEDTNEAFQKTITIIKDLKYARYQPLTYLRNTEGLNELMTGQRNVAGFMKAILVKRLESSFYAFRNSLSRFIESYEKFIEMYEKGDVYISKKIDIYDLLDNGDDEKLLRLVSEGFIQQYRKTDFVPAFYDDLEDDLSDLKKLQNYWNRITADPKLEEFLKKLHEDEIMKQNKKKIIFTESKETAEYLYNHLRQYYGDRVVWYSSESEASTKIRIENSFNPQGYKKEKDCYDLLITTDVLSEGVNLHLSNMLINYDLPWNPTRIMQRVGRVNRVGSKFSRIYTFNFFPTAENDRALPLTDRIMSKLQAFNDMLGADAQYLTEKDEVTPQKLFDELNADLDDEDGEGTNPELKYLAIIRKIRDEQPELFNRVKSLPKKSRSARKNPLKEKDSTISFIRRGALKTFFLSDAEETTQLSFMQAVRCFECKPEESQITLGNDFFSFLNKNKSAFDRMLIKDEIVTSEKKNGSGNDASILRTLRAIRSSGQLTDLQESDADIIIDLFEKGEIPAATAKTIASELKKAETNVDAFNCIKTNIPASYIISALHAKIDQNDRVQKEIILSEWLDEA